MDKKYCIRDARKETKGYRISQALLGAFTIFVATILTATNLRLLDYSSWLAYLFAFVQIVWYFLVLNNALTFVRLAFYREPKRTWNWVDNPPWVSIIIPLYKEPVELVERFTRGLLEQTYPLARFEVVVVDDSPPEYYEPCRRVFANAAYEKGFRLKYVVRKNRSGFRGGAIKRGIQEASGKYVVVMDIDHRPLPHMLDEMVAVAEANPKLDVVIFPQHFPEPRNSIENASYVGYLFDYKFSRKGKSVTNSAFCVGTNWIARRERILEAGGYDDKTIVEDMATSLKLWHPAGLRIGFAEATLAVGTLPSTLEAWRVQQYRWAYGAFHIFRDWVKSVKNLSPIQALDYLYNITWYMVGFVTLTASFFPFFTLLGVNFIRMESLIEYLVIVVGFTMLQVLLYVAPLLLEGEDPKMILRCQATGILVSEIYLRAAVDATISKKMTFKVTPKERQRGIQVKRLVRDLAIPVFLIAINVAAMILYTQEKTMATAILAFWAGYNLVWILPAVIMYLEDLGIGRSSLPKPGEEEKPRPPGRGGRMEAPITA